MSGSDTGLIRVAPCYVWQRYGTELGGALLGVAAIRD